MSLHDPRRVVVVQQQQQQQRAEAEAEAEGQEEDVADAAEQSVDRAARAPQAEFKNSFRRHWGWRLLRDMTMWGLRRA